jgi:DNA-binding MarR family transcriptional regulator
MGAPMKEQRDHIDRFLDEFEPVEGLDYEVEGIVDRIGGLNRRIKRGMEATLTEFGLSLPDWQVLSTLRNSGSRTPGVLARYLELSSGAMTSRLDGLEEAGLIHRVPDPEDRRSVVVKLTSEGRTAWEKAASAQARKEAFFASALSPAEQKRLNALLRKLMLAFEERERESGSPRH